jgi:hypothetical protein
MGNSSISYCRFAIDFQLVHGDAIFPVKACVSPDLPYQMILGLSFLEKYEGVLHVAKKV